MEVAAEMAHEYMRQVRRDRVEQHKNLHQQERGCRGLTNSEWYNTPTKQKSTFSKSKKYSCTKLWSYYHVARGEEFNK